MDIEGQVVIKDCYTVGHIFLTLRRHFAVLGSLAVILTIAIDPFAQNLVYYYQDMVGHPFHQALLARADNYSASDQNSMNLQAGSFLKWRQ
jgi:hypothetical protein